MNGYSLLGYWQSILFTLASSAVLTRVDPVRRSLVFLSRLRRRCDLFAWKRLTLPDPVSLKRFFALLWVFIFGMAYRFLFKRTAKIKLYPKFPNPGEKITFSF
jgi:hypothetical protein